MSITVRWDDQATAVMVVVYEGCWSAAEYRVAIGEMIRLIASVEGRVDGITMYKDSRTTANPIWLGQYTFSKLPDRGGVVVFVQATRFVSATLAAWSQLYDMAGRFFFADSLAEARLIIAEQRRAAAAGETAEARL